MKRILLTVIAFYSIYFLQAQEVKLGLRAGISLASFNVTGVDVGTRNKIGPDIALLAELPISDRFSVQPELGFVSMGSKLQSGSDKATYNLNYLKIPILARYHSPEGWGIMAGPAFASLLSAHGQLNDGTPKVNAKEYFNNNDFFAVIGMDYQFKMGLNLGFRYNLGLTQQNRDPSAEIWNRALNFSIGYKLGMKRK